MKLHLLMLHVVWALTVTDILCMAVWDMTLHSAVHRFQSLIEICSLHFENRNYYVSIRPDGITSIKTEIFPEVVQNMLLTQS